MSNAGAPAVDVQLLEPLLRRFVALIGLEATMRIVDAHGGAWIYIAEQPAPDGALSQLVGYEAARALAKEYGLERLRIPKAGRALRAIRDARIRADHATLSLRQLVEKYRLAERRICEILAAGAGPVDTTRGLFD